MKFNGFIVAIVVLAALGAALYWSNHHMPSETTQASAETPPKILTLNEADINKIDIKKKGGEEVTLTKDNGGNWKVIAPKPLGADQSAVSSMLSSLSSLNSDRLVEEKVSPRSKSASLRKTVRHTSCSLAMIRRPVTVLT